MDKVLLFVSKKVFGCIDKAVGKWLRFRNLAPLQRMHSNEPGAYKWHYANYDWYHNEKLKAEYNAKAIAR
jgi:hypothetical protein